MKFKPPKSDISEVSYSPFWDEWNVRFVTNKQEDHRDIELSSHNPVPDAYGVVHVFEYKDNWGEDENTPNADFTVLYQGKSLTESFLDGYKLIMKYLETYDGNKRIVDN